MSKGIITSSSFPVNVVLLPDSELPVTLTSSVLCLSRLAVASLSFVHSFLKKSSSKYLFRNPKESLTAFMSLLAVPASSDGSKR